MTIRFLLRPLACSLALAGLVTITPSAAPAYEAVTTQAGLTQQAALASRLHRRMIQRFVHPLGLFEPLRLDLSMLPPSRARDLYSRLIGLDSAEGYAPEWQQPAAGQAHPLGRQHVIGWLAAGAVIESTPADRLRNHFLDPRTGRGLAAGESQSLRTSLLAVKHGVSSLRQLLAGAALDGNGMSAPEWALAAEAVNDFGLPAFLRAYDRAERGEFPPQRETALAEMMLTVGALSGVLSQMGDPAFLSSDLEDVLKQGDAGAMAVATRFGRAGVPAPSAPPKAKGAAAAADSSDELPHSLRELFIDGHGGGLAELTARRCGTAARRVRCYTTEAPQQLRDVGRYEQRLIDYLFRGELRLVFSDGSHKLDVIAAELPLGSGTATLIGEQPEGRRRVLKSVETIPTLTGASVAQFTITDAERHDLHRVVVLFQGRDRHNEPIVTSAQILFPRSPAPSGPSGP